MNLSPFQNNTAYFRSNSNPMNEKVVETITIPTPFEPSIQPTPLLLDLTEPILPSFKNLQAFSGQIPEPKKIKARPVETKTHHCLLPEFSSIFAPREIASNLPPFSNMFPMRNQFDQIMPNEMTFNGAQLQNQTTALAGLPDFEPVDVETLRKNLYIQFEKTVSHHVKIRLPPNQNYYNCHPYIVHGSVPQGDTNTHFAVDEFEVLLTHPLLKNCPHVYNLKITLADTSYVPLLQYDASKFHVYSFDSTVVIKVEAHKINLNSANRAKNINGRCDGLKKNILNILKKKRICDISFVYRNHSFRFESPVITLCTSAFHVVLKEYRLTPDKVEELYNLLTSMPIPHPRITPICTTNAPILSHATLPGPTNSFNMPDNVNKRKISGAFNENDSFGKPMKKNRLNSEFPVETIDLATTIELPSLDNTPWGNSISRT